MIQRLVPDMYEAAAQTNHGPRALAPCSAVTVSDESSPLSTVANAMDIDSSAESPNGGAGIIKCSNGSAEDTYCCTNSLSVCDCDSGVGVLRFNGNPSVLTTIGVSTASQSDTSTKAVTPAPTHPIPVSSSTPTPTPTSSTAPTNNAHTTAIGAGVGIPLGLLALAFVSLLIYRHHNRTRLQETHNAAARAMQTSNSFYGSIPVALELGSAPEGIGREGQFEVEGTVLVPELADGRYRR
ncbi:hypothetical protein G7Y79_00020g049500 [Physcia stellaris]|nr:hypothetical protein G7Y79_00020g049500 [Physcia stellaris]